MDSIAPERMGCPYRHPFSHALATPPLRSGAFARGAGARYFLDAAEAVGQFPVDVNEVGCDLLAGTGRKFLRVPCGTGFLWVRDTALERLDPFVAETRSATWDGGRGFTCAGVARLRNLGEQLRQHHRPRPAVRQALELRPDAIGDRTRTLRERLREDLGQLPGITTHDLGTHRCAPVSRPVPRSG